MNLIFFLNNGMTFTVPWQWNDNVPNMEVLRKNINANFGFLTDKCFIAAPMICALMIADTGFTYTPAQAPTAPSSETKQ